MRFSIVVPFYNVEKYIDRCLDSIIDQVYQNFEVIVVNDGSTDNSCEIVNRYVERYSNKIKLINQQNSGLGAARNTGIKQATGEYLVFVDSDDYLDKSMLYVLNKYIEENTYDILIFNSFYASENGRIIKKYEMCGGFYGITSLSEHPQLLFLPAAAWNKIFRREFVLNTQVLFPAGLLYEDASTIRIWLEKARSVYCCNEYLYYYVQRKNSTMHMKTSHRMLDIIAVSEILINNYRTRNVYDYYYVELEYVVVSNVLFIIFQKINEEDYENDIQVQLVDYVEKVFPNCRENRYLSDNERRQLEMILKRDFTKYHNQLGRKIKYRNKIYSMVPHNIIMIYKKFKQSKDAKNTSGRL